MVQGTIEKTATLLIGAFILLCASVYVPDWDVVGLGLNSPVSARFIYSFIHASFLHALLNTWCLVSIAFVYCLKWWQFIVAYIIAVGAPGFCLSTTPTVGLSVVCFALLGLIALSVSRRLYYNLWIGAYLVLGFLLPSVNGWIHLYSYVAGLMVGLLTMPIPCRKK